MAAATHQGVPLSAARIVYPALFASMLVVTSVLTVVRRQVSFSWDPAILDVLRYIGFGQLIVIGIVIHKLRSRLPLPDPAAGAEAWWEGHGQKVLVMWALAEGTATLGAVLWGVTSDPLLLLVVVAAAVLLARLRPSVWDPVA